MAFQIFRASAAENLKLSISRQTFKEEKQKNKS
jgi:hypothetical protein